MNTIDAIAKRAADLIDAISFDNSGLNGRGGNGGLISRETIRKSDELRMVLHRLENEARADAALTEAGIGLPVGTPVRKLLGYPFPGEVRSRFLTKDGKVRYVVEATGEAYAGMLHIFNGDQIEALTANLKREPSDG